MATADLPAIEQMTPEAKRVLLGALVADLSRNGTVPLTVTMLGRTYSVYEVPAHARENARRHIESLPPEHWEECARRAADTDPANWLSFEDVLRLIPEDAAKLDQSRPPSGSGAGG